MDINYQTLKADRYYKHLSTNDKQAILEKAPKMASILASEYSPSKILERLEADGFKINLVRNAEQSAVKYRARIEIGKNRKIFIYEDSIDEFTTKFPQVTKEQVKMMFLAHEFLHYLEHTQEASLKYEIKVNQFGFKRTRNIHAYSEIVANEFAKLVTNSSINPMEIDKEN